MAPANKNCLRKSILQYQNFHIFNLNEKLNKILNTFRHIYFFHGATAPSGAGPPHCWGFSVALKTTQHSAGIPWTSDQPDVETSTWQNPKITRDRRQCPWRDSNPHFQKKKRPTLSTARPPRSVFLILTYLLTYSMEQSPSWEANSKLCS
jgi:hypothetical protein